MTLGIPTAGGVAILNALLGALAVVSVYKLLEASVPLGAVGGSAVGLTAIVAEWQIGERVLVVTVGEMKLLVVAAAVGALVGIVGTLITVKPDI